MSDVFLKADKVKKKTQKKEENNLNYNKLIKESLREMLGKGLVEGEERRGIDRDFLLRYTVSTRPVHLSK